MPLPSGQLTPDEYEPEERDIEYAKQLVAEGWHSTSNKYRLVARFKLPEGYTDLTQCGLPRGKYMLHPDLMGTPLGGYLIRLWDDRRHSLELRGHDDDLVEHKELTVRQFLAFKRHGGPSA